MKRRGFIKEGSVTIASMGLIGLHSPNPVSELKKVFVHHVYFWLKEPANTDAIKQFEQALEELVSISSIQMYHIGKPADTRREVIDSSYHYSLLVIFKDKKSHDIYQEHPKHDAFRKVNAELSSKVIVYDSVDI
ncbi:MAG TPA: Dabb family protein [Bacteroidales bacterium]|nr:Dabb family protein [Bacteroidales bacterium]